ncbi:MAG: cystathionine gamma-synthase family protein [Pseudomonadales bacterium]|nr:cystathionine gamma-synthase family protein [Pseudomonadales bacterium]MCP5359016.1 cystathionine gamma-synthase family protein [Pseudomonadales bacterium]
MSRDKPAPHFDTVNLHSDRRDKPGHGALHKPVHTSIAFEYEDARDLAAVFQGRQPGYNYGRQQNPTVNALQNRVTRMESGHATAAFATGMAAIGSTLFALLRKGDHVVSSAFLFGNTNSLFNSFGNFGVDVSFVDATDVAKVEKALTPQTRAVFVETIANPVTQVADLARIGELCAQRKILYVVDNTITTPCLFSPKSVGASLVINSLSKYFGGHGDALGGAVTDTGLYDWSSFPNLYDNYKTGPASNWGLTQIRKKGLRDFGATLAPEAAHSLAVGSETMSLRVERASDNALALARFCQEHPRVNKVHYPGLPTHPQHALASRLFRHFGALMSIELHEDVDCFDFLNRLEYVVSSSNLGDTRTLAIPVAHTIFYEMGAERRASMGIADSLIRIAVGIEHIDDLIADFTQALA